MIITVVLPDNINTASRASKEILSFVKREHTIKLIYLPPTYAYEDMKNSNVSSYVRVRLSSRKLPRNSFFWVIKFAEFFFRVLFSLMKQKPDLVFCHDLMPLVPSFVYSKLFSKKMIYDSHEIHREILNPFKPVRFWRWIETYIINHINLTIITDHHRLEYMVNRAEVKKERIKPIYNFPYIRDLRSAGSQLKDKDPDVKKVIYTGIIMPGRYIDDVIRSIPYWSENVNFYLVGDGGEEFISTLKEIAASIGVTNRVHFMGAVKWNELVNYIDELDVAFAFYKDNCLNNLYCSPNKLYEALAAGTPVIGTVNPMIKEVLRELDFGVCLDFNNINANAIGAAVNQIIAKQYSQEYKQHIKQVIRDEYSWESQEVKFLEYFDEVTKQK